MELTWTSFASWLLRAALGGGVLLAVTLLVMRWHKQPARRQRLGEIGLVAALVLAGLSWTPTWLPLWTVAAPPQPLPELEFFLAPAPMEPTTELSPAPAPVESAPIPAVQPAPAPAADGSVFAEVVPWLAPAAVVIWGLGAVFCLTRWLAGVVALWRIVRAATPATPDLFADFQRHFSAGRTPRLLISDRLRVPISCGIVRPTVILPVALTAEELAAQREWIFAHEITHLARRDAWSALLFVLGQVVYFALPWFWWLRRQVRLCQEYVADAAAVARRPADEYAEFLLSLTTSPAAPLAATGVTGAKSDLFRRVTMLLENPERVELTCPRRWTIGVAGVLLGLAVVAAGVGPAQGQAPNQKEVLEQLQRIQEMVNKLRAQVADAPKADAPQEAGKAEKKSKVIVLEIDGDVIKLKDDAAKEAKQAAERAVQRATIQLRQLADHQAVAEQQKKLADMAKAQVEVQLRLAQVGARDSADRQAAARTSLKQAIELLQKHQAELKDRDPATGKALEQALDRLKDALKLQATTPPPVPQPPILAPQPVKPKTPATPQTPRVVVAAPAVPALPGLPGQTGKVIPQILETHVQAQPGQPLQVWAYAADGKNQGRLGIRVEAPGAALAEQLNLPKDQGLVIAEVFENSIAKKAGVKANDILVKINQKAVSSDADALVKLVAEIKADAPFDIVVIRRGRQETIQNIRLAAAPTPNVYKARIVDGSALGGLAGLAGNRANIMITAKVTGTQLTLHRIEGAVGITVQAEIADGKKKASSISVVEKGETGKYSKIEEVPEAHRAKVQHLLQLLDSVDLRSQSQVPANPYGVTDQLQRKAYTPEGEGRYRFELQRKPGGPDAKDLYYWAPKQGQGKVVNILPDAELREVELELRSTPDVNLNPGQFLNQLRNAVPKTSPERQ